MSDQHSMLHGESGFDEQRLEKFDWNAPFILCQSSPRQSPVTQRYYGLPDQSNSSRRQDTREFRERTGHLGNMMQNTKAGEQIEAFAFYGEQPRRPGLYV